MMIYLIVILAFDARLVFGDEEPGTNPQTFSNQSQTNVDFAKDCFERAYSASNDVDRAGFAHQGIEAARPIVLREPTNAAAHYYLALNLGEMAQTKKMGALHLVSEMEKELLKAQGLDEKLDHGGPDRCLALVYQDAPGWPVSVGSRRKARQHFSRAVKLFPYYPDNRLSLIEALLKWGDKSKAMEEAATFKANFSEAKSRYSGEKWDPLWKDWLDRWETIQKNLENKTP